MKDLSDRDYCLLSEFAYQHLPDELLDGQPRTLGDVCLTLVRMEDEGSLHGSVRPVMRHMVETDNPIYVSTKATELLGGWQRNDGSGLCAFALRAPGGRLVLAFRGSESDGVPTQVDWIDNFGAGLSGVSAQYPDIAAFLDAFAEQDTVVTGHSKGGHNALYAAATDARVTAGFVFDGQGFAAGALTPDQARKLRTQGIRNYVAEGDVVGALLFHPEQQIFVKQGQMTGAKPGIADAHRLENLMFDLDGAVVVGRQSILGRAVGLASRRISAWLLDPATQPEPMSAPAWVHVALLAAGTSLSQIADAMRASGGELPPPPSPPQAPQALN